MSKIALGIAFGAGYVVGAKAGRSRYEEIRANAKKVADNPTVQSVATSAKEKAGEVAASVAETAKDKAAEAIGIAKEKTTETGPNHLESVAETAKDEAAEAIGIVKDKAAETDPRHLR